MITKLIRKTAGLAPVLALVVAACSGDEAANHAIDTNAASTANAAAVAAEMHNQMVSNGMSDGAPPSGMMDDHHDMNGMDSMGGGAGNGQAPMSMPANDAQPMPMKSDKAMPMKDDGGHM